MKKIFLSGLGFISHIHTKDNEIIHIQQITDVIEKSPEERQEVLPSK